MNPLNAGIVIFDSKLKEERDYWLRQLSRESTVTNFPPDFERPESYSPEKQSIELNVSGELYERLMKLTGGSSFLLYVALVTAWKICLFKHTQNELIVVGSPARSRGERAQYSQNALAIIDEVREEMSFRQLLLQVRETLLTAYSNQSYPYRRLIADFGLAGVENRCPLFDVALSLSSIHYELPEVRNDIHIAFTEETGSVKGTVAFNPQLFRRESVERWAGQFLHLLGEALARPNEAITELELLTAAERRQIQSEWNETSTEYGERACLHQLFEAQAERTPEAVAVVFGNEQASYRELNKRANRVAHRLIHMGVGPETLVGVYMERSIEMVVAILAVHKAGGAYVPLDPGYPSQYLSYMLEDSRAGVLLTQQRFAARLTEGGVPVLSLDSEQELSTVQTSEENPVNRADEQNAAYVIYTSGSTGNPKGVIISHGGILNRLLWMQQTYQLRADDRVLQKTPFSFDVSVWEFFWPLMVGARLVMARPEGHKDAAYLLRVIIEQGITTLHFVPSMLHLFLEEEGVEACASLRRLICSGEALTSELVKRFHERLHAELHNLYGPTEASVDVTCWACPRDHNSKIVPIGRPIANTRIYILDSRLRSVAVGTAGELHIGGVGLARGYLGRPELTAERFIPSPFGPEAGERLYKSGDLARYLPDGTIEFLGRIDQQVKVHGFRIELGEIEAVLAEHPAIREVVVEPRANGTGEKRLVAYFVPNKTRTAAAAAAAEQSQLYRLPNDMAVAHQNASETNFLYQEIFEEQSYLKHGVTLRGGDCVFDVGANIGLFTLFLNEACEDVKVYAFEPIPPIYELLHQNVQLHVPQAKIFNCGLSDQARQVPFTYYPRSSIMSGYYADAAEEKEVVASFTLNRQQQSLDRLEARQLVEDTLEGHFVSETFDCQLKTLSNIIDEEQIERIDLLKIDVEKSELDVIGGIREEHWARIKQVVIEVHDLGGRLQMLKSLLEEKGYGVEVDQDCWLRGTTVYQLYAVRPSAYEPDGHMRAPAKILGRNGNGSSGRPASGGVSVEELRSFALKRLPEYMVPSAFIALEQLPLSPSGKTDRKALPDPSLHRPNLDTLYVTPDTEMERTIASLWQEVLKVDKVGIHDNFFDLGGYSLIMGKVRRKLELLLQSEISMVEMFEHPTVHSLASHLSHRASGAEAGAATIRPDYERAGRQQQAINRRRQQHESRGNA